MNLLAVSVDRQTRFRRIHVGGRNHNVNPFTKRNCLFYLNVDFSLSGIPYFIEKIGVGDLALLRGFIAMKGLHDAPKHFRLRTVPSVHIAAGGGHGHLRRHLFGAGRP